MGELLDMLQKNASVVSLTIAFLALLVSLATFVRGWRWRAEADPVFVQVQGDGLLFPDFSKAGINPVFMGFLANCGDGRAFNVKITSFNCEAELWDCRQIGDTILGKQTEWIMTNAGRLTELTNEDRRFFVTITPPADPTCNPTADMTKLELGVHWVSSPTRMRRCRYKQFPILGVEPWKCGPLERLRRWHRDRKGHRRFHELDRKRASEQRKLLS